MFAFYLHFICSPGLRQLIPGWSAATARNVCHVHPIALHALVRLCPAAASSSSRALICIFEQVAHIRVGGVVGFRSQQSEEFFAQLILLVHDCF